MSLIEVLTFGEHYLQKCKFHISKEDIEINERNKSLKKRILQENIVMLSCSSKSWWWFKAFAYKLPKLNRFIKYFKKLKCILFIIHKNYEGRTDFQEESLPLEKTQSTGNLIILIDLIYIAHKTYYLQVLLE